MYKITKILFLLLFTILVTNNKVYGSSGDINLIVSPIKYEITADPGTTITKSAKIINKSDITKNITTGKSNFISNNTTGQPVFVKDNTAGNLNTELASWINIETPSFSILPQEHKHINFSINVPANATPGGHYGAIFFKYKGEEKDGAISINADYGVLILVNVTGDIIDNGTPGDVGVSVSEGKGISKAMKEYLDEIHNKKDNCKIDLTKSDTDGKCIDGSEAKKYLTDLKNQITGEKDIDKIGNPDYYKYKNNNTDTTTKHTSYKPIEQEFIFSVPFENKGNTHIKPTGKIILKDKNGNIIPSIGKKQIKDESGNVIGQEIIDYIPINEGNGNILPNTKRVFEKSWKGFLFPQKDASGNKIITAISPENYFSDLFSTKRTNLYPWERFLQKKDFENIKAYITTKYKNYNGEDIEFNSTKDIKVYYTKVYVGFNPYSLVVLLLGFIILYIIFWILFGRRKKKCKNCKKKIKKDMKICPYCETKQ